jgi:hypothetical protein
MMSLRSAIFFSFVFKNPMSNLKRLFLFSRFDNLHKKSPFAVQHCFFLFIIRSAGGGQVLARLWRVGRSMFDVHLL